MKSSLIALSLLFAMNAFATDGAPTISSEAGTDLSVNADEGPKRPSAKEELEQFKKQLDMAKVNANLNTIVQKVLAKNPDLAQKAQLNLELGGFIRNAIILSFAAQGKIYNELGVQLDIRSLKVYYPTIRAENKIPVGYDFTHIDSGTLSASVKLNGYELAKKLLVGRDEKEMATITRESKEACDVIEKPDYTGADVNHLDVAGMYFRCVAHHILQSKDFSSFLISVKPVSERIRKIGNDRYWSELVKQFSFLGDKGSKAAAGAVYYVLTSNDLKVCTKKDWTCRSEYLYAKLRANTIGAAHLSGSVTISEKQLDVSISFYSLRALLNNGLKGNDDGIEPFDALQYGLLKEIQFMTEDRMNSTAEGISAMLGDLTKELAKLGYK